MSDTVAALQTRWSRPRVIVTTDPELDDLNSMLRLLLYSNEIAICGLVYSSSQHHYQGDPARGIEPHRWPAPGSVLHIDRAVDAYAEAFPNLVRHDRRYPHPDGLRAMIRVGNVCDVGDMRSPTPGSNLIVDVLMDDDPTPVFLQAWGGLNTIARALLSIEESHAGSNDWDAVVERIAAKTVLTSFASQDATLDGYIRPRWPELEHRQVATTIWGYFAWDVVLPEHRHLLSSQWTRENVVAVGPLGREYRVWGDGEQMADGFDHEDYFGHRDHDASALAAMGYQVWCPQREQGSWISEGDSSNFALLIDNGLRSWEHGNHGGWGGRQAPVPGQPCRYDSSLAHDAAPDGEVLADFHAARWFAAIQNDFAARLRWSVTDDVSVANHHPHLTIRAGLDLIAAPGARVVLGADVSDPDGDAVTLEWWDYPEAGTYGSRVRLDRSDDDGSVVLHIPQDCRPGQTIHVIAEATDDGAPPLKRYARVTITIGET